MIIVFVAFKTIDMYGEKPLNVKFLSDLTILRVASPTFFYTGLRW